MGCNDFCINGLLEDNRRTSESNLCDCKKQYPQIPLNLSCVMSFRSFSQQPNCYPMEYLGHPSPHSQPRNFLAQRTPYNVLNLAY